MKFDEVNIRMKSYEATNTYNMLWNYADELMKDDKIATSRMVREWALLFHSKIENKKKEGEEMKSKDTYQVVFTDGNHWDVVCEEIEINYEEKALYLLDEKKVVFYAPLNIIKYAVRF